VRVGLLGPLEVADGDRSLEVGGARLQALLMRLALDAGRTVSLGGLVDAVWEHDVPADEVHALQSLVSRLRRGLGDAALVVQTPGGYRLALDAADVDTHRFERLAREGASALRAGEPGRAGRLLGEALALWRGPALAGVAGTRAFATAAAARLEDMRLAATVDRIEADLAGVAPSELVAELERLAVEHPLDERVARLQVRVLHAAGRQADALAVYERIRAALDDALGAVPGPELQAAHLAVLRGEVAPWVAAPPTSAPKPDAAAGAPRTNLRAPLTRFVGRGEELARVAEAVRDHRLVTLLGPGGAGKTRLAGEAGAHHLPDVPDGVWLVELAPVVEASGIGPAILAALGLRETALLERAGAPGIASSDALHRVLDALADRSALVMLDNCEHLIADVAAVADELLGRCPRVHVLATSREPLGIVGERLIEVPPLAWPGPDAGVDEALAHPAVELFADRGAAAAPGFAVDAGNVAAVIEICRRLDGQPLALELAAARLRTLAPDQLARRLDDRFRILTGGSRTALPRHRTLRAVVDWSWDLLTDAERTLAARLAVFPGGVTPQSAAAVHDGPPVEVLDLLAALVDRSLLQVVDAAAPRYRMLETIREYGIERLAEEGVLEAVRTAHAHHFLALVDEHAPRLRGGHQIGALHLLTAERENVVAALRHLADTGDAGRAVHLACELVWFAVLSGNAADALAWIRIALQADGDADPVERSFVRGVVAVADAHDHEAAGHEEEVLADVLAELEGVDAGDWPPIVLFRAILSWLTGDRDATVARMREAEEHPLPWVRAAAPLISAQLAENDGDVATMRADHETALARFRAVGDRWGIAIVLVSQAGVWMIDGELDAAAGALDEARALTTELGVPSQDVFLDMRLAELWTRRGDLARAREHLDRVDEERELNREEAVVIDSLRARLLLELGDQAAARALRDRLVAAVEGGLGGRPERGHARAMALTSVGLIALGDGDLAAAGDALDGAFAAAVESRDMPIVALTGVAGAQLAARRGRPADAAEMLGAAAVVRGAEDAASLEIASLTAELRAALGEDAFRAAYARGRGAERDAALARLAPAGSDAARVRA
jgi:predicted ATPase/DNA-binding SARP family transcriptional activator